MESPISMLITVFSIAVFAMFVHSKSQDRDSLSESSSPLTPPPPPPPPPPSPPPSPPPPSSLTLTSPPPLPPRSSSPQLNQNPSGHRWRRNHSRRKPRPPPTAAKQKLNTGEKVGLSFLGIVSVLQVCVVGFLVFKRRQLLKVINRYETCS